MKLPLLTLSLLAFTVHTIAQDDNFKQLRKEVETHLQQDTIRVNRLIDLSISPLLPFDERRKIAGEAFAISQKISYAAGQGYALATIGFYETLRGKIKEGESLMQQADSIARATGDSALFGIVYLRNGLRMVNAGNKEGMEYLVKAEKLFEKFNQFRRLSFCQTAIANLYQINYSNYPLAMEYLIKAQSAADKADFSDASFNVWNSLGTLYSLLADYDKSLSYLMKANEEVKRSGVDVSKTQMPNSLGEAYRLTGKYPEALQAYKEALDADTTDINAEVYESNIAEVHMRMNNLPLAFQYGFSALAKGKQLQDDFTLGWIYGVIARTYLKNNNPDSSIYYARQGLDITNKTGTIEFMRDNAEALAKAYAYKKDFANAYKYHLQYINYRDSMLNTEVKNRTAVLQYNSDLEKKQAQITQLNQQKKLQQTFLFSTVIVLTLILITAGLLLRNNRQKQKANKLLQKQKQEIDDKAHELSVQKDSLQQSYNNVELLSEIGRKISSSLSVEKIISTAYDNVNALMDASVFGIGIYNQERQRIEFPATYEDGMALPYYYNDITDLNRFAVICFKDGKEIIMGNLANEYKYYTQQVVRPREGKQSVSLIYLPLVAKENKLGVITVQSFTENAYTDYQLFMLRNIAIYTAIALENAESYEELNHTVERLKSTQAQLIQSEKMASLGELTAGIAHEIQNPLNFVNNFSEINYELIEELKTERTKLNGERNPAVEDEILSDIQQNLVKISTHGKRADSIVKGMLQHSQTNTGSKELIDINALTDEYLRLAYHGLRAKDKSFNAITKTEFDNNIGKVQVVPQDMGRVLLNLINNAYYTVTEKKKLVQNGYEPTVTVTTTRNNGHLEIKVTDNGNGIPQKILDKIFQPFFTTKPTGQGTGLGLSLSYDIVKAHGGEIKVTTKENEGTEFIIVLAA